MRVVAGSARGTKLFVVPGRGTRPILDRVKTALFDILRPRISGLTVLDLFAGSGSVGIEALSQGAAFCTFIDREDNAIITIKKNLALTRFADRAQVVRADSFGFLKATDQVFDLVYVAPPQYKNHWQKAMRLIGDRPMLLRGVPLGSDAEQETGMAIAQIHPKEYESLDLGEICETRQKVYGNTKLVFFERQCAAGMSS
jgi:16S rRNA (guanine966-N2)-methyltransferase